MSLDELLSEYEHRLVWIKKRYFMLDAISKGLQDQSSSGKIEVINDSIYQMYEDSF